MLKFGLYLLECYDEPLIGLHTSFVLPVFSPFSVPSSMNCIELCDSPGVLAAVDGAVTIRRGVVSSNGCRQALGEFDSVYLLPSLSRRLF